MNNAQCNRTPHSKTPPHDGRNQRCHARQYLDIVDLLRRIGLVVVVVVVVVTAIVLFTRINVIVLAVAVSVHDLVFVTIHLIQRNAAVVKAALSGAALLLRHSTGWSSRKMAFLICSNKRQTVLSEEEQS